MVLLPLTKEACDEKSLLIFCRVLKKTSMSAFFDGVLNDLYLCIVCVSTVKLLIHIGSNDCTFHIYGWSWLLISVTNMLLVRSRGRRQSFLFVEGDFGADVFIFSCCFFCHSPSYFCFIFILLLFFKEFILSILQICGITTLLTVGFTICLQLAC